MAAFYTSEQTNFILSDAELSMQVRSLISLFRSTRQIQSMPAKTKLAALDQRFFGIKRQEVEFLLKHCRTCAQTKPQTRTTSVRFSQSFIELYGQYKSTIDCSSWRELNFGLSLTSNFTKGNLLYKKGTKKSLINLV